MIAAASVGRVGALAIALGIGLGLGSAVTGVAGADSGATTASTAGVPARPVSIADDARSRRRNPPTRSARATSAPRPTLAARTIPSKITRAALSSGPPVDPFTTFFANTPPHAIATQTGQSPTGAVSGLLTVADPDSSTVGVAVTRTPGHGTVAVAGGQYTYTADPLLAHTGVTDTFDISVTDADSGFHLHGLGGLINLLTLGLIGVAGHITSTTVSVNVSPFNNAPTASVRVGPPDPTTGVVTGLVIGTDPNGDALTYTGSTITARGAVSVTATGEFTYTPSAEAITAAAAPDAVSADRQDTFTVTVDDGYGGVTGVPVIVPVGSGAPGVPLSTFCGCTLMPADSVFHATVSTLAVLPQSDTWTAVLGGTLRAAWGGQPWQGTTAGMPVNTVTADRPTETVIFNRGLVTSGPTIDDRPYAIPDHPLVEGMPDVPAWDRHLLVFQQGTCVSQELYNVANGVELPANGVGDALANAAYAAANGSAWIAEAGVRYDMNSTLYPGKGQANASQLPFLPLILRPDDLTRGSIDHMLGIVIAKDRGIGYTWPARSGDGAGTNPNGVPMGTVFRLSVGFDISGYDPATQVVLRALQEHGAVVYDSWGAGQNGAGLLAMSNGWTGTGYLTAQRELSTIPLSAFEAVDILSLALDPNTGWAIRT